MKTEITKWTSSIEDISIEEAVDKFFYGDWDDEGWYRGNRNLRSWENIETAIDSYMEEFQEISDKEKDLLKQEIKKEFDKRVNELRQEEINQLKDRKSILEWIENLCDDWPNEGEVGYMLSKEEILDLILKNGNK